MTAFATNRPPMNSNPSSWSSKTPRGYASGYQQQFDPQQMKLFSEMFSHVDPNSFLSKIAGGDQQAFDEMEAPAWRNFNQAQGQLASRFSGMGMGGQKSSAFKNTMGQLGSDFAQDLQSKRMQYRQQAIKDLMGLSSDLLGQRPYEQFMAEKGPSNFEKFLNYAAPMAQSAAKGAAMAATGGIG